MAGNVVEVTEANFDQEVGKSDLPVFLDFGAPRCGPCRMLEPIVEALAGEYAGKLKVCKVNADENPGLAAKFSVFSIPALYVIEGGQVKAQRVGYSSKDELKKMIQNAVGVS